MPPIKVVYIEDNPANLSLVVRVLEATGRYEVIGAPDGEAGLELIESELPALVLVDLDIPGVNGFEVTRQIKASPNPIVAGIPVAAVSANVMAGERAASLEAGCVAFISKPFDIHAFRDQIAELAGLTTGAA
ncbi:MAG TPA: response regulator [Kofleriaceae bacterium]|nr:response regulator [Kofleriaceae bacterium]